MVQGHVNFWSLMFFPLAAFVLTRDLSHKNAWINRYQHHGAAKANFEPAHYLLFRNSIVFRQAPGTTPEILNILCSYCLYFFFTMRVLSSQLEDLDLNQDKTDFYSGTERKARQNNNHIVRWMYHWPLSNLHLMTEKTAC